METGAPHIPVLLRPLLAACAPVSGRWLDGTFGAGGYARGLLAAGADHVTGVDRDPLALQMAAAWAGEYGDRLSLVAGNFSGLDTYAGRLRKFPWSLCLRFSVLIKTVLQRMHPS